MKGIKYILIITFIAVVLIFTHKELLLKEIERRGIINSVNVIREVEEEIEEDPEEMTGTVREVTMYTSTPEQTDASPCIGANGQDVCVLWRNGQNICATNAFPINTVLEIDKLGACIVIDRMNRRYSNRVDWYAGYDDDCLDGVDDGDDCKNYRRARQFGLQNLIINNL